MNELRLGAVLTRRFTRVAWTGLAGYALLVVALFAVAAEMSLRRSLEHAADLTQSLLGAYRDSTSEPGGVMPSALADRLVAMGGQVVITRTTTDGQDEPIELSHDLFRGDRTRIVVRTPGKGSVTRASRGRGQVIELRAQAAP